MMERRGKRLSASLFSSPTHTMQLHKIRACLACDRQAPHNHHMFAMLNQLVILQTLIDHSHQLLCCPLHRNAMWPDTPPERKLTIHLFRKRIRQNRWSWTVLPDQVGRSTGALKDDDRLNACLL